MTRDTRPIRVLVADDHPATRDDVCSAVENDPRFTICAEVADGISETVGCQIQMLGCSLRKPRACSRSRSIWLEPRTRPTWSISSVLKRPSAAITPR